MKTTITDNYDEWLKSQKENHALLEQEGKIFDNECENAMKKANLYMKGPVASIDDAIYLAVVEYYSSIAAFLYERDISKLPVMSVLKDSKNCDTVYVRYGVKHG